MKKHIVIAIIATVMFSAAGFAEAGGRNHGYRSGHHYGYDSHSYGRHQSSHYRGYSNRRYNRHYRQGGYYRHHGRHDYYKGLKIAAGAVVLGSLIHSINSDHRDRVVYRTRRTTPVSNQTYRVDSEGQCVEVSLNQQGQEVWTYVDSSYCY